MFWIEGILNFNRYILDADRINCWGIDDLGSEVAEFHGLYIRKFVDGIGTLNHLGIGGHETVYVSPYFQYFSVEYCCND